MTGLPQNEERGRKEETWYTAGEYSHDFLNPAESLSAQNEASQKEEGRKSDTIAGEHSHDFLNPAESLSVSPGIYSKNNNNQYLQPPQPPNSKQNSL